MEAKPNNPELEQAIAEELLKPDPELTIGELLSASEDESDREREDHTECDQ